MTFKAIKAEVGFFNWQRTSAILASEITVFYTTFAESFKNGTNDFQVPFIFRLCLKSRKERISLILITPLKPKGVESQSPYFFVELYGYFTIHL